VWDGKLVPSCRRLDNFDRIAGYCAFRERGYESDQFNCRPYGVCHFGATCLGRRSDGSAGKADSFTSGGRAPLRWAGKDLSRLDLSLQDFPAREPGSDSPFSPANSCNAIFPARHFPGPSSTVPG